jgi:lipocalin
VKFPRNERIRSTDVIAEKVEHFLDPNFWGTYNVIEPDQEISHAIKRLSGKLKRRSE